MFRHHFKLQFRIRRRAADRNGAKLGSYVASPPIPDTHINTPSPALFSDNHPVCRTHLRLPSDDLASVQWQCVCIICPDLVSSSRAETTDNMSSHPVNTGTNHSHYHGGAQWLTVLSLSQSLLAYNSSSLVRAACVFQRSCHGDKVCRYPDICVETGPVTAANVECQLRLGPRPSVPLTLCRARTGPLSTILYYPPLYSHLLPSPPITPAQNSTTTNHIYFNLLCSILRFDESSTET